MRSVTFAGLCFAEAVERLAFYAFLSVFTLYLTQSHRMSQAESSSVYGSVMLGIYTLPVLGGWLVDRFVDTRRVAVIGSGLLMLGYVLLADSHRLGLYLPLLLLCLGSGLFKPSMLALVARRNLRNGPRSESDVVWFFIAINLGAGFAPAITGVSFSAYGFSAVFLASALSAAVAALLMIPVARSIGSAAEPSREGATNAQPINWRLLVPLITSISLCELGLMQQGLLGPLWSKGRVDYTLGGQISAEMGALLLHPTSSRGYMLLLAPLVLALLAILWRKGIVLTTPLKVVATMVMLLLAFLSYVYVSFSADADSEAVFGWLLGAQILSAVPSFLMVPLALSLFCRVIPVQRLATLLGLWLALKGLLTYLAGSAAKLALAMSPATPFVIPALLVLSGALLWLHQMRKFQLDDSLDGRAVLLS